MEFSASLGALTITASRPDRWHFDDRPVPNLGIPRQLFAVSNRPIRKTPRKSAQPRPMIHGLDPSALFVWCYAQAPGDPDPANPDAVPDYSGARFPLRYRDSEVFPSYDAREWDPTQFLWRRIGFEEGGYAVTIWIWEGTRADAGDIDSVDELLASLEVAA